MADNSTLPPEFQALLAKPADEYEAPKPIPDGDYIMTVKGFKFGKANNDKKTPFVGFQIGFNEPLPSVDETALTEWLAGETIDKKTARDHEIYLTADSMFRAGEFLCDHCGVEKGLPTIEQIQAAVGCQFVAHWEQRPGTGKNEGKVFSNITSTAHVPE